MLSDPLAAAIPLLKQGRLLPALAALEALEEGHAKGHLVRAVAWRRLGQHGRARDAASRVLALTSDEDLRVEALIYIAAAERAGGRMASARQRITEARQSAAASATPFLAGQLFTELARIELRLGRTDEVEEAVGRAELAFRIASAPVPLGFAWLQRAQARLDRGQLDAARITLSATASLFRREDDPIGAAWTQLTQARYLLARRSLDAAGSAVASALDTFRSLNHPLGMARSYEVGGELLRHGGDPHGARRRLDRALHLLEATDAPTVQPRLALASVALAEGRRDEAEALLAPALVDAERLRLRRLLGPMHAVMLQVVAPTGDRERFAHHLREADELLHETGATSHDAAMAARSAGRVAAERADGIELAAAVRAHGLALACWNRLGADQQAVDDARTLRSLADRGAPIPCGEWDLIEVLGYGAMGEVWRALHHDHGAEAAVKLMLRGEAGNRRLAALIAAEVRAVAALHHPHIVEVLDHGHLSPTAEVLTAGRQRAETPWFAVTLARTGTLESQCGRLPWPAARQVLLALLDALAHAHARGVVHLDLKPANVLLDPDTHDPGSHRVLLTDFGLAGALAAFTRSPGMLGTPYTMAPEQFLQDTDRFGPWTDLYALGCLAYHLFQGRPPFPGKTVEALREAHLHSPPPPLAPTVSVPVGLEAWLHRLLEKRPEDRFACAADAAFALAGIEEVMREPTGETPEPSALSPSLTTLSLTHVGDLTTQQVQLSGGTPVPTDWQLPHAGTIATRSGASLDLFRVRQPPMIGQSDARDAAWSALVEAGQHDRPALLSLQGAPGSGRSRLLRWLGELAHERGAAQVCAVAVDTDLWPHLARTLGGVTGDDPLQDTLARLQRRMPSLPAEVAREVAAAACRVPGPPRPRASALASLLRTRARQRPQLLLLDGDWLGRHDGQMLVDAVLAGEGAVVIAAEAGPGAQVPDQPSVHPVQLESTPDDHMALILDDLLPLQPDLTRTLVRRAAGNPQLAIELLTDLADRQLLLWRRGRYELREGVVLEMPAGTRAVWERRLERGLVGVAGAERPAVVAGALLGGLIHFGLWEEACGLLGVERAHDTLRRLERAWLVSRGAGGWRFMHPMLEDVAQVLAERDGTLESACRAVATVLSRRPDSHPGKVGQLLARAGSHEQALEPLAKGLGKALLDGDNDLAAQLLDRRADALHHLGVPAEHPHWAHDALGRGRLALSDGDLAAARREGRRAVRLTSTPAQRAAAHLLLARTLQRTGASDAAQEAFAAALGQGDDDPRTLSAALLGLAHLLGDQGDHDAAEVHLDMARDHLADDPSTRAEVDLLSARLDLATGQLDRAEQSLRHADALARRLGLRRLSIVASHLRGDLARWRGDLDEAQRHYGAARDRCAAQEVALAADIELGLALTALARRDDPTARQHLARGVAASRASMPAVLQLALQAAGPDEDYERAFELAHDALQRGPRHPDLAATLEAAAVRAASPERARVLWALAADHWRELQRPREAKRAERRLAEIARSPREEEP